MIHDDELVTRLRGLRPLQKVHHSWSLPLALLHADNPTLREYARITGSLCLNAQWCGSAHVAAAVQICAALPGTVLALAYTPWKDYFGPQLPPTDEGPTHVLELRNFTRRLRDLRTWLAAANRKHDAQVAVAALVLDSERFSVQPPAERTAAEWNAAIRRKHDLLYELAKRYFPAARVEWYNFGAVVPSADPSGWTPVANHDLSESQDGFSVSLYRVPEPGYTRETFRRTVAHAAAHGVQRVTPFVALGSGYRLKLDGTGRAWSFVWDYEPIYSWSLGREINTPWFGDRPERFAPWHAAEAVCFWPTPFDPHCPARLKHFVAYVRGANGTPLTEAREP